MGKVSEERKERGRKRGKGGREKEGGEERRERREGSGTVKH